MNSRYFFILVLFFFGCEEIADIKFPYTEPRIVIEGIISDNPEANYIKISRTTDFDDSVNYRPVSNAIVRVSDDNNNIVEAEYFEDGLYLFDLIGKENHHYSLYVNIDDEIFEAQTEIIPCGTIDSTAVLYSEESFFKDEGYYMKLYINRVSDYHRWRVTNMDSISEFEKEILLIPGYVSDDFFELPYAFKKGDTILVEMMSVTRDAYEFLDNVSVMTSNLSDVLNLKTENPQGNISNNAIGFFYGSSISSIQVVIDE